MKKYILITALMVFCLQSIYGQGIWKAQRIENGTSNGTVKLFRIATDTEIPESVIMLDAPYWALSEDESRLHIVQRQDNWVLRKDEIVGYTTTYTTNVLEKSQIVQLSEQQYLGVYFSIYGDTSYTNAQKDLVAIKFAEICTTNPAMWAISYPFERSFDVCEEWWFSTNSWKETLQETFHPYPWGINVNTNIVEIQTPIYDVLE